MKRARNWNSVLEGIESLPSTASWSGFCFTHVHTSTSSKPPLQALKSAHHFRGGDGACTVFLIVRRLQFTGQSSRDGPPHIFCLSSIPIGFLSPIPKLIFGLFLLAGLNTARWYVCACHSLVYLRCRWFGNGWREAWRYGGLDSYFLYILTLGLGVIHH